MKDETKVLLTAIAGLTIIITTAICLGCMTESCYILSAGVGALVFIITGRKTLINRKNKDVSAWR